MPDLGRSDFDRLMMPNYNPAGFVPVRGQGSRVLDSDGAEYVDLAGGIATTALGHAHPRSEERRVGQECRPRRTSYP